MAGHRARWPLLLIAAPAAVAIWSGWVGLGGLCGFGVVSPLPGILPGFHINTAITLPVGVEAYGAYALGAWLYPGTPGRARVFAFRSAIGALVYGMAGQVVYHLLVAAGAVRAPWLVVVLVSCMPVVTLGFGAALTHLLAAPAADAAAVTVEAPVPGRDVSPRPVGEAIHPGPGLSPVPLPDPVAEPVQSVVPVPPGPAVPQRTRPRPATRVGQDNAAAIRRFKSLNPDATREEIAAALGVSTKTVSRHAPRMAAVNGSGT